MKNKQKYNTVTLIYTTFFLAAVILLNVIAGLLSARFGFEYDMTPDRRYALHNETLTLLRHVDVPIQITVFEAEQDMQGDLISLTIYEQLRRYTQNSNGNITVRYIDPDLNPAIVAPYREAFPHTGRSSIGVRNLATDAFRVIEWPSLIEVSDSAIARWQAGGSQPHPDIPGDFDITSEATFNTAIQFVLNERNATAAIIVGHDSQFPDAESSAARIADILTVLHRQNIAVIEVDLRIEDIPQGTELVIFPAPGTDPSYAELEKLDTFFDSPEQFQSAIFFTMSDNNETPRLDAFLREWGVDMNTQHQFITTPQNQLAPEVFIPSIASSHDIFGGMTNENTDWVFLEYVRPMELLWQSHGNRQTIPLIFTPDNATARDRAEPNIAALSTSGRFTIGALVEQMNILNRPADMGGNLQSMTTLAVLPHAIGVINDPQGRIHGAANERMITHIVNYLVPQDITVSAIRRQLSDPPMVVNNAAGLWVLYMLISAGLFVAGFVVFITRRHK
ncbi:MAG: GldG family protein [Oscillospiraceae bacterium]|nr:GldG family protein [Oscillospiraceae bacterium]